MRIPASLLGAALAAAGSFQPQLTAAPAAMTASTVAPAEISPHFAAVQRQLELGGVLYGYMDIDGDAMALGKYLSTHFERLAETAPALMLARQDYAKIFEELGFADIKAVGVSSVRDGDSFRNRAFFYTPEGRRGLLALFGGDAKPFANARLAPADADVFFETELDVPAGYDALRAVVVRIGGDGMAQMMEQQLKKPTPAAVVPFDLLRQLRGRYTMALRLEDEPIVLPDGFAVPGVSFFIRFEGVAPTFEKLLAQPNPLVVTEESGRRFYESPEPVPQTQIRPALLIEDGAVIVASSRAFLVECLSRKSGLDQREEFKQALAVVGAEGNGLMYVTPHLFDVLRSVLAGVQAREPRIKPAIAFWLDTLPQLSRPLVSVRANLPDGILVRSHSYKSLKSETLLASNGPVTVGLMAAMAIPAFQKVRANAQEKTIKNNLRMFSAAAQQRMLETGQTSVAYGEVVGDEPDKYIRPGDLKPVLGEDYTTLILRAEDKEISIRTADGRVFTMPVY